jgi:hypothetical protein
MNQEIQSLDTEHSNPVAFIVVPTFVGALIWLIVMLGRLTQ